MRSSNLSHLKTTAKCRHAKKRTTAKKIKKFSKLGSVVVTAFVVFAAVIIPSVTLIQNVEAVTNKKNIVFSAGNIATFSEVISNSGKPAEKPKQEVKETKPVEKKPEKKPVKKAVKVKETEPETTKPTETKATETETEKVTEKSSEYVEVSKNEGSLSTANSDSEYSPKHISLSAYDRDKLERLVMGEAGSLGYNGAALVAQALRDGMNELGTSSVDTIISEYQYTGSTDKKPTAAVKSAVSDIFDSDGYAVKHRILYFYATDLTSSSWHESQEFVISYGTERFFDKWD